jgi:hypothetical protein
LRLPGDLPILVLPEGFEYLRDPPQHPTIRVTNGGEAARELLARADRVLLLGRLGRSAATLLPPGLRVVQVAEPGAISRRAPGGVAVLAGKIETTLSALAPIQGGPSK